MAGAGSTIAPATHAGGSQHQAIGAMKLAYSRCMRTHGVANFPDPGGTGAQQAGLSETEVKSPQFQAADDDCKSLLPNGGNPPTSHQGQQILAAELEFSRCMRSHGILDFPDPPATSSGNPVFRGVDRTSPQYQDALQACRSDLPNGGG